MFAGSVLLNIIINIQIRRYKMKQPTVNTIATNKMTSFLSSIENKALESIVLFVGSTVVVVLCSFTLLKVNSLSSIESNQYPNYLFVNYYHLINPIMFCGFGAMIYFIKHEKLRQFIAKEIQRIIHN